MMYEPGRNEMTAVPSAVVGVARGAALGGSSLASSTWRRTGVGVCVASGRVIVIRSTPRGGGADTTATVRSARAADASRTVICKQYAIVTPVQEIAIESGSVVALAKTISKATRRLVPFLLLMYILAFLDRA